jgi:hypothetical protein
MFYMSKQLIHLVHNICGNSAVSFHESDLRTIRWGTGFMKFTAEISLRTATTHRPLTYVFPCSQSYYCSFPFQRPLCHIIDETRCSSSTLNLRSLAISHLLLTFSLSEHHAMKAYWGSGGIAPRILDLVTRWE